MISAANRQRTGATWAVAVMAGLVCFAVASSTAAETSASIKWWHSPTHSVGKCDASIDLGTIDRMLVSRALSSSNTEPSEAKTRATTPCGDESDQGGASNNICFEKTGVPATVRPRLIAKYREAKRSGDFSQFAGRIQDKSRSDAGAASGNQIQDNLFVWSASEASESRASVRFEARMLEQLSSTASDVPEDRPSEPSDSASCSIHPVQCKGVPPGPPTIDAEGASPLLMTAHTWTSNSNSRDNENATPEYRGLGPADGYGSPPDRPPRRI